MNEHIEEARQLVAEWQKFRNGPRDTHNWTNLSDAEDRLSEWSIRPDGPSQLLATIDAQAEQIRIRDVELSRLDHAGIDVSLQLADAQKTIEAQAAEITRLRAMLPLTSDGVNLADCQSLYCPQCGDKVLQYERCCVCENCGTDEVGVWEMGYQETVSKPKETERA